MALFLFCKPIVDMLYQYQILDVGMVLFAIGLLVFGFIKTKFDIHSFILCDYLVVALCLVTILAIRPQEDITVGIKVLSGYLLYFVGRVYPEKIWIGKNRIALLAGAYCVVYANFFYRLVRNSGRIFAGSSTLGELYYYKTDMAFGMLLAFIFLVWLSKCKWLKLVTCGIVIPYMVLYSKARTEWLVFVSLVLLCVTFWFEMETGRRLLLTKKWVVGVAAMVMFMGSIAAIVILWEGGAFSGTTSFDAAVEMVGHSRQKLWPTIWNGYCQGNVCELLMGKGWYTEVHLLDQISGGDAHSMYLKVLYSTGVVGFVMFLLFWWQIAKILVKENDRRLQYLTLSVVALYGVSGLTISAIMLTQMSWFTMLIVGAIVRQNAMNGDTIV